MSNALLSEGMKMIIAHLPAETESFIEDSPGITNDVQACCDKYCTMGFVDPECGAFAEAFHSCRLVFGCAKTLDADKPPTPSVRQARKNVRRLCGNTPAVASSERAAARHISRCPRRPLAYF